MQSEWSIESRTNWEIVTTTQENTDTKDEINASASVQLRAPPRHGPNTMSVEYSLGPYEVASFFAKQTIASEYLSVFFQTPCSP